MKGRHIVALGTTAALAAGATVAIGQGTGGTVGQAAQGTQTFQIRIKERDVGFSCGRRPVRQCGNTLGAITAGYGVVYQGTQRVGTGYFTNVLTRRGRDGVEMFLGTLRLNNGTITLQGTGAGEGANSITGGTGAYAGARGSETEAEAPGAPRGEFRVNLTFTFIP